MTTHIVGTGVAAAKSALTRPDGPAAPAMHGLLSKALSVQRPVVLAYLRALRRRNPDADPAGIAKVATDHYLWAVTGTGAAVGASAVIPGIGTVAGLGLAAAETGGFLELTALYAQSLAELSGVHIDDEARANVLVLGVVLGSSGQKLVRDFAQRASADAVHGDPHAAAGSDAGNGYGVSGSRAAVNVVQEGRAAGWGALVANQLPQRLVGPVTKRLKGMLVKRYAAGTVGSVVGRVLPFGVGAAVGGAVNNSLARGVAGNARLAFGRMPSSFGPDTDPRRGSTQADADLLGGLRTALSRDVPDGEPVDDDGVLDTETKSARPRTYPANGRRGGAARRKRAGRRSRKNDGPLRPDLRL